MEPITLAFDYSDRTSHRTLSAYETQRGVKRGARRAAFTMGDIGRGGTRGRRIKYVGRIIARRTRLFYGRSRTVRTMTDERSRVTVPRRRGMPGKCAGTILSAGFSIGISQKRTRTRKTETRLGRKLNDKKPSEIRREKRDRRRFRNGVIEPATLARPTLQCTRSVKY